MPNLTLFAGINGAGKTTLYKLEKDGLTDLGLRINPDEILTGFGGDFNNGNDLMKSGSIAVKMIDYCIKNKKSFNWETSTIRPYVIKKLKQAKEQGFSIKILFVGIQKLDIALKRIEHRVKRGGHNVPVDLVQQRFKLQFKSLLQAISMSDYALLFDNTNVMKIVGTYIGDKQKFTYIDKNFDWVLTLNNNLNYKSNT